MQNQHRIGQPVTGRSGVLVGVACSVDGCTFRVVWFDSVGLQVEPTVNLRLRSSNVCRLLDEGPKREAFDPAALLMEGQRNLSPQRLPVLLADFRSVQMKRLSF